MNTKPLMVTDLEPFTGPLKIVIVRIFNGFGWFAGRLHAISLESDGNSKELYLNVVEECRFERASTDGDKLSLVEPLITNDDIPIIKSINGSTSPHALKNPEVITDNSAEGVLLLKSNGQICILSYRGMDVCSLEKLLRKGVLPH